jgi:hypothetical protein
MYMKNIKYKWLMIVLVVMGITELTAQTYPSYLSTVLLNPRTLFLDEYANAFTPRIKTTVFFRDFTEPTWQFALKLKITGPNGLVIQTKPNVKPIAPVVVAPGQPYELQGADLAFYFDYNNLNFAGITRAQLEVNNRLPEGFYTFCFEAVDYETGKLLSLPSCASAYLTLNDPAIILSPVCGSVVENISMQNILFQWQLSNANGNLNLSQLTYQIDLYEVNNSWSNPTTAILNNQALPIWQSQPLQQTNYLYTTSEPPLEKGKRYVFTVKTIESNGRSSFKNGGFSMPCYFHFGYIENDTIDLVSPVDSMMFGLGTGSTFEWHKPNKALPAQMVTYNLKLVQVLPGQDPQTAVMNNNPFYQQSYLATNAPVMNKTIPVTFWANITRNGKYAWQVSAESGSQQIAKSKVRIFTGPPEIETFLAGGFLMTVTRLDSFDKVNNYITGRCKTLLNNAWAGQTTEFDFSHIHIVPLGNNEWNMDGGLIIDNITTPSYTMQPQTFADNKAAWFKPDSVMISASGLFLRGAVTWNFPHAGTSNQIEKVTSKRTWLQLANNSFDLRNNNPITLSKSYTIPVMEPLGFVYKINEGSGLSILLAKYEFNFSGSVMLPNNVLNQQNTRSHVVYENVNQLHYITQTNNANSEGIKLAQNTKFNLLPTSYIIDAYDKQSPGKFAADSAWHGLYMETGNLELPKVSESSGQMSVPFATNLPFYNAINDTNKAYITNRGLYYTNRILFTTADSIKFNTFVSKQGSFYAKIVESEITQSNISGQIYIPLLDTVNGFPYKIELTDYGFNEGYLLSGLAGTSFTFNPTGSAEQRIPISITRAVFVGHNRLEMDLNMTWPHFSLSLPGVQKLCVWGNCNIGFDVPNGKAALSYQATGKASNYDITVDFIGCGRSGNAYAFGTSAKINMDEDISGEDGAPVINAYSICKNPLLTGMVFIPPPSTTTTTTVAVNNSYQSATSGYSNTLGTNLNTAFANLGVSINPLDSNANMNASLEIPDSVAQTNPLIPNNIVSDLQKIIDIVYKLKPIIQELTDISDEDWATLDVVNLVLQNDIVQKAQTMNAKELLNYVLVKVLNEVVRKITQPIENISNQAVTKVQNAINGKIVGPINSKIEKGIGSIFTKLQQKVLVSADEQYHPAIKQAFSTVSVTLKNGIVTSVSNSFETNITSKITGFIKLGVTAKITGFVKKEVTDAGMQLINNGANANINFNNILNNAGTMFASIADTVKDVIMNANGQTFINTAESLVDDAINGIDWNAMANTIANEMITKGLVPALANQLTNNLGGAAGAIAQGVLSNVKFDFSNLGQKLQNGQFDKIVKFDPTTIYIESPTCDVRGTLKFTKNDPTYGDSWQAEVFVRVKVPKKDNPIECTAFFLNGKTTQQPQGQNFTYWFIKLGVTGLAIPLSPIPLMWDGADGFAYSKMKKTGPTTVVPDKTNKFGVGCKFYFTDATPPTPGKTIKFGLGVEAEFNDAGFAIVLVGDASILNSMPGGTGLITGTGSIGYYKTATYKKIAGNFSVKLNTEPLLCAGGDVGFDLRGTNNWKFWVGTQANPIGVKVLCKNFLSNTAFLEMSNTGFQAGLNMNVSLNARSPWIEITGIKVRGYAYINFGYSAYASVEWDPSFKINEATISAWLNAGIGIEYETPVNSGSVTLAGVSLSGTLQYKSQPQSELHGALAGSITVIGFSIGFNTDVHYSLSNQQIIN